MKKITFYLLLTATIASMGAFSLSSCKKGKDDPIISLKTRKDRFTNTWTLTKYEKNGANQDISGTTYTYDVRDNGTLKRTVQGSIFGFPTQTTDDGTWQFVNDEEDVNITINGSTTLYNVQRLASSELWLQETRGSDVYVYYFNGK